MHPPAEPAASASGGRQGAPPAAASGGASQGVGGAVRIINLAGEVIADGFMPSGGDPPDGGPPCPEFLQWDPARKKYRRRKGGVPPPSFGGGGGGGGSSPNPGGDEDESSDNSSSATSQVTRSAKSGRNALTRKKEATEVRFDTSCEPRYWRRYKRKCKKLLANASGYPDECYRWLGECEKPGIKIADLEDSKHFPTIDSTFATGLIRAIPKGHEVEVELNYLEQEYENQENPAMVKG